MNQIEELLEKEDYDSAKLAVSSFSTNFEKYYWEGIIVLEEQGYPSFQKFVQNLITHTLKSKNLDTDSQLPDSIQSEMSIVGYLLWGFQLHLDDNLDAAKSVYLTAFQKLNHSKEILKNQEFIVILDNSRYDFAKVLLQLDELPEALELMQEVAYPTRFGQEFSILLAQLHRHLGNPKEAIHILNQLEYASVEHYLLLGHIYRDQTLFTEAILSYQEGLKLDESHVDLQNSLQEVLLLTPEVSNSLRTYIQSDEPDPRVLRRYLERSYAAILNFADHDPNTIHLRAALTGQNPDQPPQGYVEGLFDDYAERFDDHLQQKLHYQVPLILSQVIQSRLKDFDQIQLLDLGVGTGLLAENCQNFSKINYTGVDVSQKMLDIAASKQLYQRLHHQDIVDFMFENSNLFQIIAIADTLVYFGDLSKVFEGIARTLTANGFAILTVEQNSETGFQLQYTGRYSHNIQYIYALAQRYDLQMTLCKEIDLRQNSGTWVKGWLIIMELRCT